MRVVRSVLAVVVISLTGWSTRAAAFQTYYGSYCQGCHGATTVTNYCAACHAHGTHSSSTKTDINVAGTLNKATYAPGETVTVTVNGGYRPGWVRVLLLDENMQELARSSCGTGAGIPPPCTTSAYPVTLTHAAPTSGGAHTWAVAWYGNYQYEGSGASFGSGNSATLQPGYFMPDSGNPNHGYQVVALPSFTVTSAAAPAISVVPAALSFGNVPIGTHVTQTVTVSNTGTALLNVTSIARAAGTSASYSVSPTTLTVNPNESHAFNVTYTPTGAGAESGSITITSDDPAHPTTTVSVSGTGTTATAPTASVSPSTLTFGDVTIGGNTSQTITVSNSGNASLTGTVALGSGTSGEYKFSPASLNVAAGGTQTVTVTYTPTDQTTDAGQLVLTTNDPAHATINVALSGNGVVAAEAPRISVTPASLDFGTIALGTTKDLPVKISNTGTAALIVSAVDRCTSPATSTEFTWTPAAPITVAPGQNATVTVTYTANDPATEVGCLALTSNDAQSAVIKVDVTGAGQAPSTDGGSSGGTVNKSSSGCSTGEGSATFAALALLSVVALRNRWSARLRYRGRSGAS